LRSVYRGLGWKGAIFIGRNVELRNRKFIKIGKGVTLGDAVLIDGLSRDGVVLGNNVNVGEYTRIEASGTITDIGKGVKIGDNTGIGSFSFIGGAGGVLIGRDVIMGQWVSFHPENHNFERLDTLIRLQGVNRKGIVIEDDCWIGAKVTFVDGAHVGHGCVIAAGALVRGYIPPYSVAVGIPARIIRSRKVAQPVT
jgi:acetyltransferase-like isoleucine patch superfamily enzyme